MDIKCIRDKFNKMAYTIIKPQRADSNQYKTTQHKSQQTVVDPWAQVDGENGKHS